MAKQVLIKQMVLSNFKNIRSMNVEFGAQSTTVSGTNEQGKSTVYDAYLWCLFGITTRKNDCVQPTDANNEIVHKIDTEVTVVLLVDGVETTLRRRLTEKWKAEGTAGEKFISAPMERFYNDVPCSVKEFEAKLGAIYNVDSWLMLSNIKTFMQQKMEERRRILASITGEIDTEALLSDFPLVKAELSKGKTLEEVLKQTASTKKRAQKEIDSIPNQIAAQDKLRVTADFAALHTQKDELDAQIADLDKLLEGDASELEADKRKRDELAKLNTQLSQQRTAWSNNHFAVFQKLRVAVMNAQDEVQKAEREQQKHANDYNTVCKKLKDLQTQFEQKKQEWLTKNNEEFTYVPKTVCECCGQPLSTEAQQRMYDKAATEFNTNKADVLQRLYNECGQLNTQIATLKKQKEAYETTTQAEDAKLVSDKKKLVETATLERNAEEANTIEQDSNIKATQEKINVLQASMNKPVSQTDAENIAKRNELKRQRDEIVKQLAGEQTNANIDKEKERLNKEASKQSQIVADCNAMLEQIRKYNRKVLDATESKLNVFFQLARWKFSEQNKTNDDEQQVCTAVYKGIEYDRLNNAGQVNVGIDICEGIKKACGVELPLFVDNVESVENVLGTQSQIIKLRFVPGAQLTVEKDV